MPEIMFGLAKGAAITMFVYYFFKALTFIHDRHWQLLEGFWGWWYVLEVIGLVLVPCCLFAYGVRHRRLGVVKLAAVLALAHLNSTKRTAAPMRSRRAAPSCSRRPILMATPSPTASPTTQAALASTATPVWSSSPIRSQPAATPSP